LTILISNLTLNEFFAILSNTSFPTSPVGNGLGVLGGRGGAPIVALVTVPLVDPAAVIVGAKSLGIGGNPLLLFDTGEYDDDDPPCCCC
jgi:hypothetical protein